MNSLTTQEEEPTQTKLQSDSSSNSDNEEQTLDGFIQEDLCRRAKNPNAKGMNKCILGCVVSCFACFVLAMALYVSTLEVTQVPLNQSSQGGHSKGSKYQDLSTDKKRGPSESNQNDQEVIQPKQLQSFELPMLNDSILLQGTYFANEDLTSGNNHWFRSSGEVQCIPDMAISSAHRISQHIYAQKTVYSGITLLMPKIDLPAKNIYQFEPARQFLFNISTSFPPKVILFDHPSPFLLLLTALYSRKGFFVSDRHTWSLFEKNLVFNDLYLPAIKHQHQRLIESNSYDILITTDLTLLVDLLVVEKKKLSLLVQVSESTAFKTAHLLKMKVYKLSQGYQCGSRGMQVFEEARWRISEEEVLSAGWYVFTYTDNDISFGRQTFNYEERLNRSRKLTCLTSKEYVARQGYFKASKLAFVTLSYSQLVLYQKQKIQLVRQFRQVYGYLMNNVPSGTVYLHSGPVQYLLVVIASLPPSVTIHLSPSYPHQSSLLKQLALNNLQKLSSRPQIIQNNQYQLIVTSSQPNIQQIQFQHCLLFNQQELEVSPHYQYSELLQQECEAPKLKILSGHILKPGLFVVSKLE